MSGEIMLSFSSEYKTTFTKKIFELDTNSGFKNKAQKYQHIIKSFLVDENRSFKITEIQDRVLEEYSKLFKVEGPISSQIKKNQNHQFNKYLHELEEWKLLASNTAKGRGGIDTKEYRLTNIGKTFALIIEYIHSKNKQNEYDKLFDNWKSYLTEYSTSLDLFCLKYLDKCKKSRFFNEFADFFIKSAIYSSQHIRTPADLFTQMTLVKVDDEKKNKTLFDMWRRCYYELDNETQNLFSNHMSMYLNRITMLNAGDCGACESKRYESRINSDGVIAEFYCNICKSSYEYVIVNVLSYISYVFNQPDLTLKEFFDNLKCEGCKKDEFEITVVSDEMTITF